MTAFQQARSSVGGDVPFLSIGKRNLLTGEVSVYIKQWLPVLDELEEGRAELDRIASNEMLPRFVKVAALSHYNNVYQTCVDYVALPSSRWDTWYQGLRTFVKCNPEEDEEADLQEQRAAYLLSHQELLAKAFAGCWIATSAELQILLGRLPSSELLNAPPYPDNEASSTGATSSTSALTAFERRYFPFLQAFSRLCYGSEHMFGEYAKVGRLQREWLTETLLDKEEEATEVVLRNTFRRDFAVPCAALVDGTLSGEYSEVEADSKKEKSVLAIEKATLAQEDCRIASRLFAHELSLLTNDNKAGAPCSFYDDSASIAADELVQVWKKSPSNAHRAFAFTMQRILVKEAFPPVLNAARLEFVLHLLHQWLEAYLSRAHRWSVLDPFTLSDDSDLWQFVLDRHDVLLRLALLTAQQPSPLPTDDATSSLHTRERVAERLSSQVDCLSVIAVSLLHCRQVYLLGLTHHPAKPIKRTQREECITSMTRQWISTRWIQMYAAALLNDTYRELEPTCGEGSVDGSDDSNLQACILSVEGKLKLVICSVLEMSHEMCAARHDVRRRLQTFLNDTILPDDMFMWKHMDRSHQHTLLCIALRMARRLCYTRGERVWPTDETEQEFVRYLGKVFKQIVRLAPDTGDPHIIDAATEEWLHCMQGTCHRRYESSDDGASLLNGLLGVYCSPGRFQASRLIDTYYERRRAVREIKRTGEDRTQGTDLSVETRKRPRSQQ